MTRSGNALVVAGTSVAAFALGVVASPLRHGAATAAVSQGGLPATRAPGSLERPSDPKSIPGNDAYPIPADSAPHTRAGAQALARKVFGDFSRQIQNFQKGDIGSFDLFFTPSRYLGWPGLCEAEAVSVSNPPYGGLNTEKRYLVVGSFESPRVVIDARKPGYAEYKAWERKAEANCAARDASTGWFTVRDADAWRDARLFDGIVAAARAGNADFPITCSREPSNAIMPCSNPRETVAALAPNDIDTIEGKTTVEQGIRRRETTVSMHGNPYFVIVIRRESSTTPGARNPEIVKAVEVGRAGRPIID